MTQEEIVNRATENFRKALTDGLKSGKFFSISLHGKRSRIDSFHKVSASKEAGSEELEFFDFPIRAEQ